MKTLEIKLFNFNELTDDAKEKAIEGVRNLYHVDNNFAEWAIDDCALLEPLDKELFDLLGKNYNFPLIKNNRKINFSLDRDRYINVSDAMEITNKYQFLMWLGIPENMIENVDFSIGEDTILIEENSWDYEFNDDELEIIDSAVKKFENHCENILNRIKKYIDYRFSDEAIIEDILSNSFEFTEDGAIYQTNNKL